MVNRCSIGLATRHGLRRRLVIAVIPAAAAVALAVCAGASAEELKLIQCAGGSIHGKGGSLQRLLQKEVWNKRFNTSPNQTACNGVEEAGIKSKAEPKVSYTSTGSGEALESWGIEAGGAEEIRFGPENAFIATGIAPSEKQKEEIVAHSLPIAKVATSAILTIPVLQAAMAIVVHLPKGCEKVKGGPEEGRLAFHDATLEKIFRGVDTKWSQILNGSVLEGSAECSSSAAVTRVARKEGSGTTDALMKWLDEINKTNVLGEQTWKQLSGSTKNTTWPNEGTAPVLRSGSEGGSALEVAENPGTVGYTDVVAAHENESFRPPTGGSGKATFWGVLEGNVSEKHTSYYDPSTNNESAEKSISNCSESKYSNGTEKFPPPTTKALWNEVVAKIKQSDYSLCYFNYELALTTYEPFQWETIEEGRPLSEPPTEAEARTVRDYISYELSTGTGGGQGAAEAEDYFGDPTNEVESLNVLSIARKGAKEIGFK